MRPLFAIGSILLISAGTGFARRSQDWTLWKGNPARTGVSPNAAPPPMNLLWRFSTEDNRLRYTSPIVAEGHVFFCSQRTVYCVDDETGAEIWRHEVGGKQAGTPAYADGILYLGNPDRFLYAIDAATGGPVWQFDTGGPITSSPVIIDGKVIFGSGDAYVYALSVGRNGGRLLWKQRLPRAISGSPAADANQVYVACTDMYVYGLRLKDGVVRWKSDVKVGLATSPAVVDDLVLVGSGEYLYALRTRTGSRKWRTRIPRGRLADSPVVKDGIVYCGTMDGRVVAFETTRGRVQWETELGDKLRLESTPTVGGKCLWIGSSQGFVFGLSLKDGALLWKYRIHDFMHTRESLAEQTRTKTPGAGTPGMGRGMDTGGTRNSNVKRKVNYNVFASPVVIGDRLYVQGDDGTLYRFSSTALDDYPPELKTAEVRIPSMDPRRKVRESMDPDLEAGGEDRIVEINGMPPITMVAKIVDEGSGVNEKAFQVTFNGQPRDFKWESEKSLLTIDLAKAPKGNAARVNVKDGTYRVDILCADWAGNRTTHTKWIIVNNNKARPRLKPRETNQGGVGGRGGGLGGGRTGNDTGFGRRGRGGMDEGGF